MSLLALIQALKALQLKIKQLENDRLSAADHFKHLSQETQQSDEFHKDKDFTFTTDNEEENIPPLSPLTHPPDGVYTDPSKT